MFFKCFFYKSENYSKFNVFNNLCFKVSQENDNAMIRTDQITFHKACFSYKSSVTSNVYTVIHCTCRTVDENSNYDRSLSTICLFNQLLAVSSAISAKTGTNFPNLETGNEFRNPVRVPGSCYKSMVLVLTLTAVF